MMNEHGIYDDYDESESQINFNNHLFTASDDYLINDYYEHTIPIQTSSSSLPITSYANEEVMKLITQELHRLSIDLCNVLENGVLKYKCQFIFSGADLLLTTGNQLLSQDPQSITVIIDREKVKHDDLFIKAGSFVRLLKNWCITNGGLGNIKQKYFDTNTYVTAFKLGIRVSNTARSDAATTSNARKVAYIKLRDSLEFVRQGLLTPEVAPTERVVNTLSSSSSPSPSSAVRKYKDSSALYAYNKTESLRQCVCLLAEKVHTIERGIAGYLKDKVQSPSLTYHDAESIEILLSNFIVNSKASEDTEVINRIKQRCQIISNSDTANDDDEDEDGNFIPVEEQAELTLEDCLEYFQEIKKRRLDD